MFTHGAQPTIAVSSSSPDNSKTYAVNALRDEEIADTTSVGDAFAGGLVGAFAAGKSLDEAIEVNHTPGTTCVMGLQYKWPKVRVFLVKLGCTFIWMRRYSPLIPSGFVLAPFLATFVHCLSNKHRCRLSVRSDRQAVVRTSPGDRGSTNARTTRCIVIAAFPNLGTGY